MKRTKTLTILIALSLGVSVLCGCVSTSKYKTLQSTNADLQSELDASKKSLAAYEQDLGAAKQDNAALTSTKAQLEKVTAQLQAERDAILSASAAQRDQYNRLVGDLKKELNDGNLKITQYKNMLTVDVADKILFDSGKADIKADGKAVLQKVGEALAKSDKYIRVVGHTDNVPLTTNAAYTSNWELSAARATTVVRFLQDKTKLDPQRLMAIGRGEYAPIAPNDTPANKQKNRRIEITLLDKNLVEAITEVPATDASPAAQ